MAFDTYLIIGDGTKNPTGASSETTATGLTPATGWIAVYSFSWGVLESHDGLAGGHGIVRGPGLRVQLQHYEEDRELLV